MKSELREFVESSHFPAVFLGVVAILAVLALVIGWKIYPYTIGGFERFEKSPIQHFFARCAMAFVGPLAIGYYGYTKFTELTATPADKVRAIEQKQQQLREQVKSADDPFDGKPATPSKEQVAKMRELESEKQKLRKEEVQREETLGSIPQPPKESEMPAAAPRQPVEKPKPVGSPDSADGEPAPPVSKSIPNTSEAPSISKVAELKGELAKVNSKIESERARWTNARDTINRLTNFKKTPVKEGSPAYHQCMAASKVIHEVESGASDLKAEKARLEAVIKELEE
jgi:hypothetical protein